MDFSFDAVASKCAHQMAQYQNCVQANVNGDWSAICREQGRALTRCADESVPYLAEMKRACFTHIEAYRTCLDTHGSKPDDVIEAECGDKLKKLWECTDKTKNEIDARKETK
ncbi:uncharacterized protein CcaverHIS019_0110260 [Cutaneotrichosporon cavernicola]|uniref:IMS import disulfide relay-system CHCH-CHCH-like Cx9C domain-containing protein n=1 Tax=Cutaneotrichosporon cavernicola TaxID=279322 RepID=A0AA48II46_9TREE|nr:uncharacterized protein CcaverHIS019_0110260 [Cutaneotrichosporon cavernicola]BEI88308.1 hypothetical protein CcaverHIS019_0110260 [Cutaneotrichosporon cavernicola]BEI96080.1 hypothetical protein CcaverHIS631_0110290 [Cutaneotrichosporon cavernicola]